MPGHEPTGPPRMDDRFAWAVCGPLAAGVRTGAMSGTSVLLRLRRPALPEVLVREGLDSTGDLPAVPLDRPNAIRAEVEAAAEVKVRWTPKSKR